MTLEKLYRIICNRRKNMAYGSYIASLFREGEDRIIQKIGEETTELVIAAKNNEKQRVVEEMADLWFHSLILLAQKNIPVADVWKELEKRNTTKRKR
jgi:phosphoribosyl-ATP pyrophosphohydrolase